VLAALAAGSACRRPDRPELPGGPLPEAARFLWARQGTDGGFHSTTYGLLASGQALTPFILDTLLDVPEGMVSRPAGGVEAAFAFIRRHTDAHGALGLMDEASADYPNYATALAVQAFAKAKPDLWNRDVEIMVGQLRRQQFSEANGWGVDDAPYGGWGMGGPIHRPPEAGHVDLSMTRCVLEALREAGVPPSDPVFSRSRVYLGKSQNADGGFFFSLVNPDTNKAGETGEGGHSSYGTATADGLLALRAAGFEESDDRVVGAARWLDAHHEADRAPGFDSAPFESWADGLRFYYAGVISRARPRLQVELPDPGPDGGYRNANTMVKEDDPLIATTFALKVLLRRS
jgi:hypothetical protein